MSGPVLPFFCTMPSSRRVSRETVIEALLMLG
jgi:hypothetical protein